jgi:UDP-glucose:(heptosyl)LPS alpha-1,3-glucosyltransferase
MRLALNFYRVDPKNGGAETYVRDLCHRLVRAGHRVDLYANSWRDDALPPQVGRVRVEAPGLTAWQRIWHFAQNSESALREAEYDCTVGFIKTWYHDVIIPQGGVIGASLEYNSRRFPPGWQRTAYRWAKRANPKDWVYRSIERKQYRLAQPFRVVAVSHMVRQHLERYHGVPRSSIRVIPNAIDADRLAVPDPIAVGREFRREHRLADDDLVALFVGHNFWLKGLKPLLLALHDRQSRSASARPIHLLVCGGGRTAPFRRLIDRLRLTETVHLIGFAPDIRACYWASDFLVLPTYYDPCSLVVFEALACGLPVITTACNGASELITDGQEGFVVSSPIDHASLADRMELMANDTSRSEMSARAARLGRAQSFDNHIARLLALFEEVAATKATRGPRTISSSVRTITSG